MYLNRRELLTTNQRAELMKISDNITEKELVCYYTLSFEDIDTISIYRHGYNKLGFALQLTILRHSGWPLVEFTNIPMKIVHYVADQIDVDLKDFYKYFNRKNTKYDHLESICKLFNYKKYNKNVERFLFDELLQITQSEINSFKFVNYALNILRENKVVNPSIRSVERIVWQAKENIQDSIFNLIDNSVTIVNKKQLDNLITVQDGDIKTKLSWLRGVPGKSSSKTFNEIANRIEYIRSLELENIDLNCIHNNKIEELCKLGSKYEVYDFKRFDVKKRYSILSIYLIKFCEKLIDQAIQIHDIQVQSIQSFGKKEQENLIKKNGEKANLGLRNYVEFVNLIIKTKEEGKTSVDFKNIENIIPWEEFVHSIAEISEIISTLWI